MEAPALVRQLQGSAVIPGRLNFDQAVRLAQVEATLSVVNAVEDLNTTLDKVLGLLDERMSGGV